MRRFSSVIAALVLALTASSGAFAGGFSNPLGVQFQTIKTDSASTITVPSGQWNPPAYNGSVYVATSSVASSTLLYSSDGTTFVTKTLPVSQVWGTPVWYTAGSVWIIFDATTASSATGAWSADGQTWNSITLPSSLEWNTPACNSVICVSSSAGPSSGTAAMSSPDGKTWTARSFIGIASLYNPPVWFAGGSVFIDSASGGTTGVIARSTDGITWTSAAIGSGLGHMHMVVCNSTICFLTSANTNEAVGYSSTDGTTWTSRSLLSSASWSLPIYTYEWMLFSNASASWVYSSDAITWSAGTFSSGTPTLSPINYGAPNVAYNGTSVVGTPINSTLSYRNVSSSPSVFTAAPFPVSSASLSLPVWVASSSLWMTVDSLSSTDVFSSPDVLNWTLSTAPGIGSMSQPVYVGGNVYTTFTGASTTVMLKGIPSVTTSMSPAAAGIGIAPGALQLTPITYATLPPPFRGLFLYCTDCSIATTCTGGGSGAFARAIAGAWNCN